jgi:orotidine-5'-phosphate decarboxylase
MQDISDKLIVALDVDTLEKVKHFVDVLCPKVKLFKVGSSLFPTYGLEAIRMIGAKGGQVFLDLKSLDIPNTVSMFISSGTGCSVDLVPCIVAPNNNLLEKTISNIVQYPVFMMTVHSLGGIDMLKAALQGATIRAGEIGRERPRIVGVTVLTSETADKDTPKKVLERARLVKDAGLDGVVCAVSEAEMIRKEFGEHFIIVTPGIRPKGTDLGDQKRVATAKDAIAAGANFIVVGRPILEAKDPLKAVEELI